MRRHPLHHTVPSGGYAYIPYIILYYIILYYIILYYIILYYIILYIVHIHIRHACRWQACLLATAHHTQYVSPRRFVYAVLQNLLCSGGTAVAENESTSGCNAIRLMACSVQPTAAVAANGSRVPV